MAGLVRRLRNLVEETQVPTRTREKCDSRSVRPKARGVARVLIADDDPIVRQCVPFWKSTFQITGLVSGHRDKAERIAAEYGVPASSIYNYENFDEIAHNPAIDAVYVALPKTFPS